MAETVCRNFAKGGVGGRTWGILKEGGATSNENQEECLFDVHFS